MALYWVLKDEEILQVEMPVKGIAWRPQTWIKHGGWKITGLPGQQEDRYDWSTEHV